MACSCVLHLGGPDVDAGGKAQKKWDASSARMSLFVMCTISLDHIAPNLRGAEDLTYMYRGCLLPQ
eukprot:364639-Chlamydomonas_euryale.AAC.40